MEDAPNIDIKPGQGGRLVYDKARRTIVAAPHPARPLSEWHEDIGPVLWWKFPVTEAPYIGSPLDTGMPIEVTIRDSVRDYTYTKNVAGWPGYHTHWTPLPAPPPEPLI